MSYARRLMLAVAATCLVAALAAPTAGAASAGKHSKATSSASAAKKSSSTAKARTAVTKKRLAQRIRTVDRRSKRNRRNIIALRSSLSGLGAELRAAIAGGDKSIDDKINGIVGVVTPVLVRLGDAALALEKGLKDLAAATTAGFAEVSAGFDEVEAALTDIGAFLGATEYGAVRAFVRPGASTDEADFTAIPGFSTNTSDIPDNGQGATVTASLPYQNSSGGPQDVTLRAAIRSNESDGEAGGDPPAGQVGGILYAKCASIPGVAATECAGGTIDPGQIVCAPAGPPPPQNFGSLVGTQPLENIPTKDSATSFTAPTATDDINPTGEAANADCTLPANGLYEITFAVQFFDFPTSTDPGPTE